jgi:hypothetical protein
MRRLIYTAVTATVIGAASISGSYAAGPGSMGPARGTTTTGSATNPTGLSSGTGNTGMGNNAGMGNSAGSAAAGANSVSNPSGNQLMPGSPTTMGGGPVGGRR